MAAPNENDLIEALYEAALGQRSWGEATSDMVSLLGGETLILSVLDPGDRSVEVIGHRGLTTDNLQEYLEFAHLDPWLVRATDRKRTNAAVIGTELVTEAELVKSFMYNEFLKPRTGVHHLLGAVLAMDGGRVGIIGTHRPRGSSDFVRREARRLDRLLPHLKRALEVRQKLETAGRANRLAHAALDRLSVGVLLLSAAGALLHANSAAEAILRARDGLIASTSGLRATNTDDNKRLQMLIAGFRHNDADHRSAGGHLRVRRPSGRPAFAVMVAPAASSAIGPGRRQPAILVFISDPREQIVSDADVLRQLFGFSQAEARLVLALLSGISLPDFAQKAGVTYNTVRTLLTRAMARADVRSQLELVLRVTSAMAGAGLARKPEGE